MLYCRILLMYNSECILKKNLCRLRKERWGRKAYYSEAFWQEVKVALEGHFCLSFVVQTTCFHADRGYKFAKPHGLCLLFPLCLESKKCDDNLYDSQFAY